MQKINRKALRWARRRISDGHVAVTTWPDPDVEIVADPEDLSRSSNYFLDIDDQAEGVAGLSAGFVTRGEHGRLNVNRNALVGIRHRAMAENEGEILAAVEELLALADGRAGRDGDDQGRRRAYLTPVDDRDEYRDRAADSRDGGSLVFQSPAFELRAEEDDQGDKLTGYAAVFDQLSESMWWGKEKIAKGAFAASLKRGDDVIANVEHEGGLNVIGRRSNGTLDLEEDDVGLRVVIRPPDTNAGVDVVKLVRGEFLTQMSFAFIVRRQELDETEDELLRTLLDVDLFDVAVVAFPAYTGTSVDANSRPVGTRADAFDRRTRILEASVGLTRPPASE